MSFPVFPVKADKTPLINDWAAEASTDPAKLQHWQNLFGGALKYWGIPCGPKTGLLALDVDVKKDGFAQLHDKYIPETYWQDTQSGGRHYLFKYPSNGKHFGNRVNFLPGLDSRGAGGYIVHYGLNTNFPLAEAPEWFQHMVQHEELTYDPALALRVSADVALRMLEESLEEIRNAPAGESNNTLNVHAFRIGQLVGSDSLGREHAEQALLKAATERGKPLREALATIKSGLDGGCKKPTQDPFKNVAPIPVIDIPTFEPAKRWTPQRLTRADLMAKHNLRRPQLFRNWSTQDIAITSADGGTGKSTLKLLEAVCLALGDRFLGFDCINPGKTLFITGEDTEKKLAAMLGAILEQLGLFQDLPGNAEKVQTILNSIVIKKDSDLCLVAKDRQGFITTNPNAMTYIMQAVEDLGPFKMIVFDPISSFWGAESAVNDMARAVAKFVQELVVRTDACVEIINHIGKSSSASKDMGQYAGRGGTGLPSHSRVSRALRPLSPEEYIELTGEDIGPNRTAMLCQVNKFSDGSPLLNQPFVIVREGYLFERKNLSEAKVRESERQSSDIERIFRFVKEARENQQWVTEKILEAHFATLTDAVPMARIKRASQLLLFQGFDGYTVKLVENPNQLERERVFTILLNGQEI